MKYYVVDTFTDTLFSGNPAGVCVLDEPISPAVMQKIAQENNLPETAFVIKAENGYHLRWFTPNFEVDLCGHATLGTAFVLANFVEPGVDNFHFSTQSGPLLVTKSENLYEMDFPSRPPERIGITESMLEAIGLMPIAAYSSRDLILVVETEQQDVYKRQVLFGIILVNGTVMEEKINIFGVFCGLMSAVMYALMVILNKQSQKVQGLENSVIQLITSFLTVAIFVGFKTGYNLSVSGTDLILVIVLGLINTGIGCYLYFSSIGKLPVQTVAICGYLEPLSAVILATVILNETMLPLQIIGAMLIIGGAVFGECYKRDNKQPRQ